MGVLTKIAVLAVFVFSAVDLHIKDVTTFVEISFLISALMDFFLHLVGVCD